MDSKQEQKFHELTEAPVSRLICRLALPCIISMLVTAFYNMADTFFVGMLKSPSATGAVGVVFSMMAIIQAVGFFFGHGSGNFISRELGKQNTETASNMAATGFSPPWPQAFSSACWARSSWSPWRCSWAPPPPSSPTPWTIWGSSSTAPPG